ncbi:hypothetical protein Q7O_004179 [Pectobacterium carotovorum subsp. carotovorum PCCS1]|nr:hypothetical protein [Pectobacterium carotovorum subsp. carotovorum PCCS1]
MRIIFDEIVCDEMKGRGGRWKVLFLPDPNRAVILIDDNV